jgi:CDP-glucose 4,6-dehydratase
MMVKLHGKFGKMISKEIFGNIFFGKTVFVTGHTGFIGSWISLWLKSLGANVVGYSIDIPTKPSMFEIIELKNSITHVVGDINNLQKLQNSLNEFKPSFVFHLAAQPIVRTSYEKPIQTLETNIIGTANLLESIRSVSSVKSAVFITSDKSYKNLEKNYAYTEDDPLGGHDTYSSSKAAAELIISSYRDSFFHRIKDEFSIGIASVRAGNVIGGGDWGQDRLMPDCINSLLSEKKILIRNPDSVRPFQHVLEPIYGILKLSQKLYKNPKNFSSSWNMGPNLSKEKIHVSQFVDKVIEQWGSGDWENISNSTLKYEAKLLMLNSSKAKKLLNWETILTFDESISETISWYAAFNEKKLDMNKFTLSQIENYSKKTKQMNTSNM